jgi:integrase
VKVLRVQRKPRVLLSPSDTGPWLAAVDQVASEAMRTVIRLALGLGLREMEAARARWEWVDWDARVYRPGQTKGKEAKPRPIPGWLLDYLRNLQRSLGRPKAGWIAPRPDGSPYEAGRMRRVMAKANAKVGIKGLTPHRLRGSYITYLLAAKVPLHDVQQAVGHADVRTTLGYAEVDLERVRLGQDEIASRAGMLGRRNGATPPVKQAAARVAR